MSARRACPSESERRLRVMEDRPKRFGTRRTAPLWAGLMLAALALAFAAPAHAVEDPWEPGTSWLSMRAGYAKLAAENAPNGAAGYGFGYSRMLKPVWVFKHLSLGGYAHHEMLGKFNSEAIIAVPISIELNRHFMWNGGLRPYFGAGFGANFIKGYRFPDTPGDVRGGGYLVSGSNVQLNQNSLIGIDARAGFLADLSEAYVWSVKLNYVWVY
jgi:opacity protein-like surface antigen